MTQPTSRSSAKSKTPTVKVEATSWQARARNWFGGLIAAVIVTTLFIPADSVSVYAGETLPQVLLILITGGLASLCGLVFFPRRALDLVVLGVGVLGLVVSTLFALQNADGRAALNGFWHVIGLLMFALLVRQVAAGRALSRALTCLLVMCAAFQATYALHQYFVSMPESRAAYLSNPDAELQRANIDAPPGSELRTQYESRLLGSFEPTGTFALTNSLAVPLSATILALLIFILSKRTTPSVTAQQWKPWLMWLILALIVVAWLLTKSRTAYLSVIVVGLPSLYFSMRRSHGMFLGRKLETYGMAAAVVALLMLAGLVGLLASDAQILSEAPMSVAFRLQYWQAATRIIISYPLTGVGLGSFQTFYPRYKVPEASEVIADPHNWIFDLAACCSVLVLIVALLALLRIALSSFRALRTMEHADDSTSYNPARETTTTNWFWLGAGLAFVLTSIMQLLVGQMLDLEAALLGLVVSLACLWAMQPLSVSQRTLKLGAFAAASVMVVCLLATGSWQASGIALPWAAWLAIALPSPTSTEESSTKQWSLAQLITCAVAIGLFYFGTWGPVNSSWSQEQVAAAAWRQGDARGAEEAARLAVASDTFSTSARTLLVQVLASSAQQAASDGQLDRYREIAASVEQASDEMIGADENSYLSWNLRGENALALAAAVYSLDRPEALLQIEAAAGYYAAASDCYPSSVAIWAQRAVTLGLLANIHPNPDSAASFRQQSQQAADQAVTLSQATPHINRQLAAQQVWLPRPLSQAFPDSAVVRPVSSSPWAKAEPLCNLARTKTDVPQPAGDGTT